jgi:hypothetical protein
MINLRITIPGASLLPRPLWQGAQRVKDTLSVFSFFRFALPRAPDNMPYYLVILFFIFPFSSPAGESSIDGCNPVAEINSRWQTIRLRSHENAFLDCTVSKEKFNELVADAFADPENLRTEFKSLFIGRLVEYPWLSKYLATQALMHPDWDAEQGKYAGDNINAFVAGILSGPEILEQIQQPLNGTGYTVNGVSVEKVLIGKASEIEWLDINEPVMVPYDVMVHYILNKVAPIHHNDESKETR